MCILNFYLFVSIETKNLTSHQGMTLFEWCWQKENLILPLSPYIIPWLHLQVVINRTILVDKGGYNLLYQLAPNSRKVFFASFFHKCKLCIVWNWFIVKIIWIPQKYIKKSEQRSVINLLVAEKCKPCEIYRRMCEV